MEASPDGAAVGDLASSVGSLKECDASTTGALPTCIAAGFTGQVLSQHSEEDLITATKREVAELRDVLHSMVAKVDEERQARLEATATKHEVAELRGVLHRSVTKADEERQARLEAHAEVMAELARWPTHREGLLAQVLAEVQREHSAREVNLRRFVEESKQALRSALDVHIVELRQQMQKDLPRKHAISELESAQNGVRDGCGNRSRFGDQTTQVTLDAVSHSASASTASESPCCKHSLAESVGGDPGQDLPPAAPLPTGYVSPGSSSNPTAPIATCVAPPLTHSQRTSSPRLAEHDNRDVGFVGDASCLLAADASCSSLLTPPPSNLRADTPVVTEVSPLTTAVVRLSSAPAFGGSEQVQPQARGHPGLQLQLAPPMFGSAPANAARRRTEPRGSPLLLASSGSRGLPSPGGLAGPNSSPCRGPPDQRAAFTAPTHSPFATMPCSQFGARPGAQIATNPNARTGLPGMQSIVQTSTPQSTPPSMQLGMQVGVPSPLVRPGMQRARSTPRLSHECTPGLGDQVMMLRPGVAAEPRWKAGGVAYPSRGPSHLNGLLAMPAPVSATEFRPHQRPSSVPMQERRRGDPRTQEPPVF